MAMEVVVELGTHEEGGLWLIRGRAGILGAAWCFDCGCLDWLRRHRCRDDEMLLQGNQRCLLIGVFKI